MATISPRNKFVFSLVGLGAVSAGLLIGRFWATDSMRYVFLLWNIVLAAVSPLLAWWLVVRVRAYGWVKWQQIVLTVLWVLFLPNSFYLITDLVHLRPNYEASVVYDTILLQSFVLAGLAYGYTSIVLVQTELYKRLSKRTVWAVVSLLFLLSSYAIYLGRFSRFNSWDVIISPAGLIFDVSDSIINPAEHKDTFLVTAVFFVVLLATYVVIWEAMRQSQRRN